MSYRNYVVPNYDSYDSDLETICSSCNTIGSYYELTTPEAHSTPPRIVKKILRKKSSTKHNDSKKNRTPKKTPTKKKSSSSKSNTMTFTPKDGVTVNINFIFLPENNSCSHVCKALKKNKPKRKTSRKNTRDECVTIEFTSPPVLPKGRTSYENAGASGSNYPMVPIIEPPVDYSVVDSHEIEFPPIEFPPVGYPYSGFTM